MGSQNSKVIDCLVLADDSRDAKGKKSGGIAQVGWLIGAKLRFGETLLVREISPQLLEFSDPSSGSTTRHEDLTPVAKLLEERGQGLREMQIWSHGGIARPVIGDTALSASSFRCFRDVFEEGRGVIWFRCCNVARDRDGHEFLKAVAEAS